MQLFHSLMPLLLLPSLHSQYDGEGSKRGRQALGGAAVGACRMGLVGRKRYGCSFACPIHQTQLSSDTVACTNHGAPDAELRTVCCPCSDCDSRMQPGKDWGSEVNARTSPLPPAPLHPHLRTLPINRIAFP